MLIWLGVTRVYSSRRVIARETFRSNFWDRKLSVGLMSRWKSRPSDPGSSDSRSTLIRASSGNCSLHTTVEDPLDQGKAPHPGQGACGFIGSLGARRQQDEGFPDHTGRPPFLGGMGRYLPPFSADAYPLSVISRQTEASSNSRAAFRRSRMASRKRSRTGPNHSG